LQRRARDETTTPWRDDDEEGMNVAPSTPTPTPTTRVVLRRASVVARASRRMGRQT
jgi:hypothetical protein